MQRAHGIRRPRPVRSAVRELLEAPRERQPQARPHRTWLRPPALRTRIEQGAYWTSRKRSALWEIDPESLEVTWLTDLPSRGDTSFGAVLAGPDDDTFTVLDYTSPLEGIDPWWVVGQLRPTVIVASDVRLT